jgi:hypothetical protein
MGDFEGQPLDDVDPFETNREVDDLERRTACFVRTANCSMSVGYVESFFAIRAT